MKNLFRIRTHRQKKPNETRATDEMIRHKQNLECTAYDVRITREIISHFQNQSINVAHYYNKPQTTVSCLWEPQFARSKLEDVSSVFLSLNKQTPKGIKGSLRLRSSIVRIYKVNNLSSLYVSIHAMQSINSVVWL